MANLQLQTKGLKTISACLTLFCLVGLSGCNGIVLSERQKVVKASNEAVCKENDFKAMRPYVSKNSTSILDLSSSLADLSKIFVGSALSDRLAIECHSGGPQFVDEVKVSDVRYIVRSKNPGSETLIETIVIREDGAWKIALIGR
jgi:hypothetical protein